jgi:hypothetical protein
VARPSLDVDLQWRPHPVTLQGLVKLRNIDAVYILVTGDAKLGYRPLKVGLTQNLGSRLAKYPPGARFFVATLRKAVTTKNPAKVLPTIEHTIARVIQRAAHPSAGTPSLPAPLDPKTHRLPRVPFIAAGRIRIAHVLPAALRASHSLDAALHASGKSPHRFDALRPGKASGRGTAAIPRGTRFEAASRPAA